MAQDPRIANAVTQARALTPQGLYSHAAEAAAALPQAKGSGQQMLASLKGVKPDELNHSGAQARFADQRTATKDELAQHFHGNLPQIQETVLGGRDGYNVSSATRGSHGVMYDHPELSDSWHPNMNLAEQELSRRERLFPNDAHDLLEKTEGRSARYKDYTMPGGSNYRELLMHLPTNIQRDQDHTSSHWDQKNVLAHLRLKDRDLPEGGKALHMEELQSDWGQDARKNGIAGSGTPHPREALKAFRDELYQAELPEMIRQSVENGMTPEAAERHLAATHARGALAYGILSRRQGRYGEYDRLESAVDGAGRQVPAGPYIDNTDKWVDLGLKRALYEAAKGGYDKMVWTPGEEQARRYGLEQHIGHLSVHPLDGPPGHGRVRLVATAPNGVTNVADTEMHHSDLDSHVGKELADKIRPDLTWPKWGDKHSVYHTVSGNAGPLLDTKEEAQKSLEQYPESLRPQLAIHTSRHQIPGTPVHLSGLDLRTGGEGHKYFYDKVIPKRLQALIKDHDPDAKLTHHPALVDSGNFERLRHMEESHRRAIENGPHPAMADSMHAGLRELQRIMADNTLSLPGVEITPKMRESILKNGFKAYKRGGRVARADGGSNYQPSLTAAIRIGKNTHTGRYHRDIYAKMTPEERAQAGTDGRQFGFVDETGRYLHRATAMQYAKDMGLLDPRHADTTSPHLIAEHLADRPARADGGGVDKPTVIKLGQRKQNPGVAGFMKDYLASTTEHPFDRRSSVHGDYATTEVSPKGHEIHLHDIRSLNPQKGGGTRALKELLTLSDKHGVPISGTAKAYHNDPRYIESSEGLRDWYKKHGFEDFGGDKWDGYDVRYNPRPGRADGGSLHWEDEPPSAEAIANDARRRQFANPHYTPEFQPTLPHDPTSREKRATELGYTHHGFHGTRADFPAFHPSKVDVGTHIGTDEQANERLRQTQQWSDNPLDHDNIIPVRAKLGKSFHMPDVGGWDDSVEVMNNMVAHGARMNPGWKWPLHMTEVLGRTIDKRNQHQDHWQRGQPDWEKSPENKHALSLINTHLRQNGYGSIKYKNMSENVNGGKSGLRHDVQKHYDELQKQIDQHYAQHHTPGRPSQCNSGNCNVGHLEEKRRALVQNRDNYNDTHSYIVLDPAHLRSRFAQFDPARAHEPDLLAAKGGFMRKPRADGGSVNEDDKLHTGPIHSPVAGRTDHLPMHVPSGSYVIPADIIGAMGEGNTMAGFKHVRRMFGGIPYGNQAAPYGQDKGPYGAKTDTQPYDPSQGPYQSELPGKAHGGSAANHVAIVAAGGEYVLTPDEVRMAGDGDLERGHRVLDEFIKRYRQKTIKTLQKLPGPARD